MNFSDEIMELVDEYAIDVYYFCSRKEADLRKEIEKVLRRAHEAAYNTGFTHGYDEALAGSW